MRTLPYKQERVLSVASAAARIALVLGLATGGTSHDAYSFIHAPTEGTKEDGVEPSDIAGGQWSQDHYSSLKQINRRNVHRLKIAWTYDTKEPGGGLETNPLVVADVIYGFTTSQSSMRLRGSRYRALERVAGSICVKNCEGIIVNNRSC